MTTELSSAKYLPAEYTQALDSETQDGVRSPTAAFGGSPQDTGNPYTAPTAQSGRPAKGGTAILTIIAILLGLFGLVGTVSAPIGMLSQAAVANMDTSQLAAGVDGKQTEVYRRSFEIRKQFSTVIYLHNGICFLVGLGFLASCFLLLTQRPDANSFAATACFAAIFYNIVTVVVSWVTMPSFEGVTDMPDEAASIVFGIGIGIVLLTTLFKLGMYTFMICYLNSKNIKSMFESEPQFQPDAPMAEAAIAVGTPAT